MTAATMFAFGAYGSSVEPRWRLPMTSQMHTTSQKAKYNASQTDLLDDFQAALKQWRAETAHLSLIRDMVRHSAFRQIVAMGDVAIPWIVRELKSRPDFLVFALPMITKENPVPASSAGKLTEVVNSWLLWAERNVMDVY